MEITKEVTVGLPDGLHARPASELVKRMKPFRSRIEIHYQEKRANAKSILEVMTLAIRTGETVSVTASGDDAREALACLEKFLAGTES